MTAEILRNQLVDALKRNRSITTSAVESAFRRVPRHEFLPGLTLDQVYRDDAIVTRWAHGLPSSSSSQPAVMAIMAEQLDIQAGQAVLEIGTGTGYNAAILRELVGPTGRVVSVEIQPDVAEEAKRHLVLVGYGDVSVVTGDGGLGYREGAPYDRMILTAGAADISPWWVEQLHEGGLLLMPLRFSTMCLCVAFAKGGRELSSRTITCCGFMPLQGAYGPEMTNDDPRAPMGDGLYISGPGSREVPLKLLEELLSRTPRRVGDLKIPVNDFGLGGGLGTYLALTESGLVDIFSTQPERWGFHYISGMVDRHSTSLCLVRRDGVVVYGSDAAADQFKMRAREWIEMGRPGIDRIRIAAAPAGAQQAQPGRWLLHRRHYDFAVGFVGA